MMKSETTKPRMMTTAAAKKYVEHANFVEYQKLGGTLGENRYRYIAAMFIRHTMDVFISGDCTFYPSRQAAVAGFQKWANQYGSRETATRIFQSLDRVHAYT